MSENKISNYKIVPIPNKKSKAYKYFGLLFDKEKNKVIDEKYKYCKRCLEDNELGIYIYINYIFIH